MPHELPAGYGRNRRRITNMKFWVAVLAANLIGAAMATYCAAALRALPETDGIELAWKVAYYGCMFVVGVVDALFIDQFLFAGSFRLTHIRGLSARFSSANADVDTVAATLQRSTFTFPSSVVAATLLTYLLFNLVNHDFDSYYRDVGRHFSALRGDAPERAQERRDALFALSVRNRPEVVPFLLLTMGREGEVGAWSAWALGRHRDEINASRMIPPLVAAASEGDPALRREAMLALARLQHRPFADEIQTALAGELDAGGEVDIRLIWALAYLQDMSSLPVLERALYVGNEDLQRAAAWAISQHRDQPGGRKTVAALEARLPSASFQVKCAIVHGLGVLSDESSNLALMHAHDGVPAAEREQLCRSLEIFIRPDRKEDRYEVLTPQENFERRILQSMGAMRATTPELREVVEPWLAALIVDPSASSTAKESAKSLLDGIRAGRDDSAAPGDTPPGGG